MTTRPEQRELSRLEGERAALEETVRGLVGPMMSGGFLGQGKVVEARSPSQTKGPAYRMTDAPIPSQPGASTTSVTPATPVIPDPGLMPGTDSSTGLKASERGEVPESKVFKFDIDNASAMALTNRIAGLNEKRTLNTITDLERQELLDLNNRLDELTTKGAQGAFSNQALLSLLPQLFSQPMEQSELDRQYAKDMSEYQARQQQIAMQRQRETLDRSNAFQFAKSILPNFDFSGMENELDPKLLPELIRYAMNKAQLSASKQNQRMAQPIVKFA